MMAVVAAILTSVALSAQAAQRAVRLELLDTAVLAAPRLTESSGVAASRLRPGLLWTHNDSGDGPVLYATDSAGSDLGFVRIQGAGAVDWEDLAVGPCVRAPGPCLYVGDIGDNRGLRDHVVIYRLPEPRAPEGPADTLGVAPLLDSIVVRYPDRPHDAEALAVTPEAHLLIITKERSGPPVLFRARAPRRETEIVLERVGELSVASSRLGGRVATGAAVSPDGTILAVRTYVSIHLFRLDLAASPTPLTGPAGLTIPVVEALGEGVTFDDRRRLVLTSERGPAGHAVLSRLRLSIEEP